MDYKSRVLDENALFYFPSSSGIYSTPINKMLGSVNKYSNLCVLPMDSVFITNIFSDVDWLSYNWLLAQLQSPGNEFKLVITLIHEES